MVDLGDEADRKVRATILRRLVLDADRSAPEAGLRVRQADFVGVLDLTDLRIDHTLRFDRCQFAERPRLNDAHLRHVSFRRSRLPGLMAYNAIFDIDLRLCDAVVEGKVNLSDARIGGSLALDRARILPPRGVALSGTRLTVGRDIIGTGGFTATGLVLLNDADVSGSIRFAGARISNPGGRALSAPDLSVGAICDLCDGFTAEGSVVLAHARIHSKLCFDGARIDDLDLRHVRTRELVLRGPVAVDLGHAEVDSLRDDPATWPERIKLDGFRYRSLSGDADRLPWLRRDPQGYRPQAYAQLAVVLREHGQEAAARTVLLAGERHGRDSAGRLARWWGYVQDVTVGYGYRPGRAAAWFALLVAIGMAAFTAWPPVAAQPGQPVGLHPLVYALDVLLPIVDFGQERSFTPVGWTVWLAYALTAAGWVLATTIAAGATRTLRK
ncbi:MAG: membrane-associated oxidoreductase [Kribbellaceae bacterium]|nr:membrane-associated oxidoreductase [Kribbellaceae bacterium]